MKAFKLLAICLVIFTAAPVFAGSCGGGGCDKNKDKQAFTLNAQNMCDSCGCKDKDKECDKDKGKGCDKGKPAPQCGGSGCDKNKGETKI